LGSTGSIGRQALEVIDRFPGLFRVVGLSAGLNTGLFRKQIKKYRPKIASLQRKEDALAVAGEIGPGGPLFLWGQEGLEAVSTCQEADIVLTAVTGTAGLVPTVAAVKAGKDIALANKETLVAAGPVVTELAGRHGVNIFPVDSEHSAIWQSLQGSRPEEVDSLILTASGGPFLESPPDLDQVTVELALKHPNWNMGKKITVDSADMMNKGLEVIEARWLFKVDYDRIKVVIHPQSIVHSMVEFIDGSVIAQMGLPDMRLPIQYALTYPGRCNGRLPKLDWAAVSNLNFRLPDTKRFPLLELAYQTGRRGGTAPAVMNAANEIAVNYFLDKKIKFTSIYHIVEETLNKCQIIAKPDLQDILYADEQARRIAGNVAAALIRKRI